MYGLKPVPFKLKPVPFKGRDTQDYFNKLLEIRGLPPFAKNAKDGAPTRAGSTESAPASLILSHACPNFAPTS